MGDDPNHRGNSRRWIITAVENSLRRLQTDHLDLYQVHRPDPTVDVEETLSALTDLVRSGKVRAIGCVDLPRLGDRRGPVGRRAPRARALPHRAAAVLDRQPGHRARGAAGLRALRDGHAGLEPARPGAAHRPLPQGPADRHAPRRVRLPSTSPTSASSTWSNSSSRSPRRPACSLTHLAMAFADRPPGRHVGDHRAAHHGAPRRPARGRRGHPGRRGPRPDRRDRAARAPTSAPTTSPTPRRPSSGRRCAAGPPRSAQRPEPRRAAGRGLAVRRAVGQEVYPPTAGLCSASHLRPNGRL